MRIKSKLFHYAVDGDSFPGIDVGEYLVVDYRNLYCNVYIANSSYTLILIDVTESLKDFCEKYGVEEEHD